MAGIQSNMVNLGMVYYIFEGSLEVKHPTIWTDGKAEVGRIREEKRREEERRSEKRKSQKKEDAGARKGRKVAKDLVPHNFVWGSCFWFSTPVLRLLVLLVVLLLLPSSHSLSTHTLSTHTLSTHTLSTHTLSTHTLSTYTLSPHTYSHLHTHTLCQHTLCQHTLSPHTLCQHTLCQHTLCHHTLTHTYIHTHFVNIHFVNTLFLHTLFVNTHLHTHTLCQHTLCQHTLSPHTLCQHTLCQHTLCQHTLSTHTLSPHTYSHLHTHTHTRHTLSTHTLSPHIHLRFAWQAWHNLTSTVVPPSFHVAGVAQTHIHRRFAWQAWHLWYRVAPLGPDLAPVTPRHFAWQAWYNSTSTVVSRGRRGTNSHSPSFCVAGVALMVPGGALGPGFGACDAAALCVAGVVQLDIHRRFTWQVWHELTSTVVLRGRCGTYGTGWRPWARIWRLWRRGTLRGRRGTTRHPPSFHVAGVARTHIHRRVAWQAWHLWYLVAPLGPDLAPVTPRHFAWQAWYNLTSTFVSRGRRGTTWHPPSFHVAGVARTHIHRRFACLSGTELRHPMPCYPPGWDTVLPFACMLMDLFPHTHTNLINTHTQ